MTKARKYFGALALISGATLSLVHVVITNIQTVVMQIKLIISLAKLFP